MTAVATLLYITAAIWLSGRIDLPLGLFVLAAVSVYGLILIFSFALVGDDQSDPNRLSYTLLVGGGVVFLTYATKFVSSAQGSDTAILATALGLVLFMVGVAGIRLGQCDDPECEATVGAQASRGSNEEE